MLPRAGFPSMTPRLFTFLATAAFACQLGAQPPGRSARISLSDSISVFIHLGGTDTSITASTPQGVFRLRADSTALAAWAKSSASLPGPTPESGTGSNGKMMFSGSVLKASDESGNAMRLSRLSGDSLPVYALAASNGAWEFSGRIAPEKIGALFHALAGTEGQGLTWQPDPPRADSAEPGFRPAEAAPDNPHPRYPARAELGRAAGEVVAQFTIGPDGRVVPKSLLIVRATHPLFALAVRDALPSMRFLPATRSGVPVATVVLQMFDFRLP